jgi:hypothetical protein
MPIQKSMLSICSIFMVGEESMPLVKGAMIMRGFQACRAYIASMKSITGQSQDLAKL